MNDVTRRYLDGEIELADVPEERRAEAEAWSRMLDAFRVRLPTTPAPPWLEDRVMAEIEALPPRGAFGRALQWLVRPRTVRLSPAVAGLAVAVVMAVLLVPWPGSRPATTPSEPLVYVQFRLSAPGAASVVVTGDFDEWGASFAMSDVDGDGVWTGRVPVRPGVYTYMFVVDGSDWVTDPGAERYTDDGFGNRNAVLAVAAPEA